MTAARPDLAELITAYSGYVAVPRGAWSAFDAQNEAHDRAMREGRLPSTKPAPAPVRLTVSTRPVSEMTVGEVAAELKAGAVALAGGTVISEEHQARRQQLWARADAAGRRIAP